LPDAQEPVGREEVKAAASRLDEDNRRLIHGRGACVRAWFLACGLLAAVGVATAASAGAGTPLRVVATTSDLRSLVEAVGGDRIAAIAIVPPTQDAEEYQPRPQDLQRLRDAAMVVRVGVDYDLWLDRLLSQTGNAALGRGGERHVDASRAIALLDVRGAAVGPGHPHGSGNPHYWLDPANAEIITGTLLEALIRLDGANAAHYERMRLAFIDRLGSRRQVWANALMSLQGVPMIAYHNNWAYFARRFRLNFAGYIELKPGVPPSAAHLAGLISAMRTQGIKVIVRQPNEPEKNTNFLAERSGARVVTLATSVGSVADAGNYLSLFDHNVAALARGHAGTP
jgi:ABC-type Zn uptake system ZnuABC Zn-binding protein ZnuA